MNRELSTNKQGQSLGKKGMATRERLLKAAEKLLRNCSPMDLTAVAIAKEAQSSSATFYMYFDDVKDAFFALSNVAGEEVAGVLEALEDCPDRAHLETAVADMVRAFNAAWDKHRHILRFRNLEADRGDENFDRLRLDSYKREIHVLARWIRNAGTEEFTPTVGDSYALASVLHASMERLASVDPQIVRNGVGEERLLAAQTRVIAQVLSDTPKWGVLPLESKPTKK